MKKFHLVFGIITLAVIVAGLIHGSIAWIVAEAAWDAAATSFPTWSAFALTFLWYSFGTVAVLIVWGIAWLILRLTRTHRPTKGSDT